MKREIGLWTATGLVIANTVGTGVFTTSGFLLADLGSANLVLLAWSVGGVIAMLGAICYGALARVIPESGGEYVFLSKTLHPALGYLAGWISLLVGFSAPIAAAAFAFGEYTQTWFGGWPPKALASILILLFAGVHAGQLRRGTLIQDVAVVVKLCCIGLFIVLALPRLPQPSLSQSAEAFPTGAFAVSLVWIAFSYSGWNAAVYLGGEVRNPERNLPLAMIMGTGCVMGSYLLLNYVFVKSAPMEALAGELEVARIAARSLGGPQWANAITIIVALALVTSVSAMMMAGPRVYAKMAEDGYLPRWFQHKEGPPKNAIYLQAGIALLLLWTSTFTGLLTYIGFTLSLSTGATVAGLIRLKMKNAVAVKVIGWPIIPILYLMAVMWMAAFSIMRQPKASLLGLATIGVGWLAWRYQHQQRNLNSSKPEESGP